MAFNPLLNFNQGVGTAQNIQASQKQNQISQLQNAIGGQIQQGGFNPSQSLDFQQLSTLDPSGAERTRATFESLSNSRKKAYHEDLKEANEALKEGDGNAFLDIMNDRLDAVEGLKGDPTGTQFLLDKFNEGDIQGLITGLDKAEQAGIIGGFLPDPETRQLRKKLQKTAGQREFDTLTEGLTKEQKSEAALIKLGLSPRAVGSAIQTISDKGIAEQIGKVKATIKQREKFGELTASRRSKVIDSGFNKIEKINAGIGNIDRAIKVLNSGAGVGAIERFLPSFKASSVELDNIQKSMALDVIGSVTFGALSQGELDLAKEVALPTGLDTPQLIEYLGRRKTAQEKLRNYYNEQIQFLDQGGTVAGFMRSKDREQEQPSQQPQTQQNQVLRFDAQGNQI